MTLRTKNHFWTVIGLVTFLLTSTACARFQGPNRRLTGPTSDQPALIQSDAPPTVVARSTTIPTVSPTATMLPTKTPEPLSSIDVAELLPIHTLVGHTADVKDVAFSPDGSMLASGSVDGTVRLWRVNDGSLLEVLEGHEDVIQSLDFSPDGALLASGSNDGTVRLWQIDEAALVRTIRSSFEGRVLRVAFSPDGSLIALADHLCVVQLRYTKTGILWRTLAQPMCAVSQGGTVSSWGLAFSPDGSRLVTGESRPCCGGSLQLWQVEDNTPPQLLRGYNYLVHDATQSPDGSMLAVVFDGSPVFWLVQYEDGKLLRTFEGHSYRVNSVAFSPSGDLLVSGSRDQKVRLWEVGTGDLLWSLEGHTDEVNSVAFSPDGRLIASASDDDRIILWGVETTSEQ